MTQSDDQHLIIGAGIGGLTLAIALLQRGLRVAVYEQADELLELGAGLSLPPPAMRVYNALGLWPQISETAAKVDGILVAHYRTGERIAGQMDPDWTSHPSRPDQHGHSHRALVHRILVDAARQLDPGVIRLGHSLVDIEQEPDRVVARFANDAVAAGRTLIGADGLRSTTCRLLFGDRPAVPTGVIAVRATVPTAGLDRYLTRGRAANFIGPGMNFLRYGLFGGTALNCVGLIRTDQWTIEGWDNRAERNETLACFAGWHEDVVEVLRAAPENGLFKWALYDREPLERWSVGRATLLGDAAHPMLPYLAHGATTAIEDAWVLAKALTEHATHDAAFAAYEDARRERTRVAMAASRLQGEALRDPDPYRYPQRQAQIADVMSFDAIKASA